MVICLERGADLHMAQLMPLLLTVSCFSKIQIGFTFLVPARPGSPGKRGAKQVYVCMSMYSEVVTDSYQQRDIRLAQSLMARSVILNVSGFETRCRISSVTLQPVTEQRTIEYSSVSHRNDSVVGHYTFDIQKVNVAHNRITKRRVLEFIPVLFSQPAGDMSHKPDGRLPLLSARPAVIPATLKTAATNFAAW